MTDPIVATHHYLLTHYGPLLTLDHLAEITHSTPDALRMAISRQRQPLAVALAKIRRRVGRKVFFEARRVAEILVKDEKTATGVAVPPKARPMATPSKSEDRLRKGGRQ